MADIVEIINRIGNEVENSLGTDDYNECFKQTIILYSLAENLLKYLVATKICWNESCKQVDDAENVKTPEVDFGEIRTKAKNFSFYTTIDAAYNLCLISEDLKKRLHELRLDRNDLIHGLYLYQENENLEVIKEELISIKEIIEELTSVFEDLIYEEIGVVIPEVLETL